MAGFEVTTEAGHHLWHLAHCDRRFLGVAAEVARKSVSPLFVSSQTPFHGQIRGSGPEEELAIQGISILHRSLCVSFSDCPPITARFPWPRTLSAQSSRLTLMLDITC